MKSRRTIVCVSMLAVVLAFPMMVTTVQDSTGQAVADAVVHFGSMQPQPAPPANNNVMVPDEVTIDKGGTVTFIVNGGAHGIAIYPVSKNTVRQDIAEDLCQGGPVVCNFAAGTANLQYLITDGKGDLIIDTGVNPPESRVNYSPDRLMSAGVGAFLIGSTAAGAAGTEVVYRFEKAGRYLVICINRGHSVNDWMFGFVNVEGTD